MAERRVVLAYAGDLVSSIALAWLLEHGEKDVATVTIDLGQGRDLNDVRDRALGIGAARAHVIDARDTFAKEAVAPAWRLPLDTPRTAALGRPFIAKHLLEVAQIEGATAVAHGSAFPANDPLGLEAAIRTSDTEIDVLAPAREWTMDIAGLVDYGRARGIPVPSAGEDPVEVRNLWGRVVHAKYVLTRGVEGYPHEPAIIDLTFERGVPVALNGVAMSLVDVITSVDTLAGAHGIGRVEYSAHQVREELPASFVIHHALATLGADAGTIRATCLGGDVSFSASTR
jgi:argininosuccinate synthase